MRMELPSTMLFPVGNRDLWKKKHVSSLFLTIQNKYSTQRNMFIRVLSLWREIFSAEKYFHHFLSFKKATNFLCKDIFLSISFESSWSKIFSAEWLFNFIFYLFSPRNNWSWIALCPEKGFL